MQADRSWAERCGGVGHDIIGGVGNSCSRLVVTVVIVTNAIRTHRALRKARHHLNTVGITFR